MPSWKPLPEIGVRNISQHFQQSNARPTQERPPSLFQRLQRALFWIISRAAIASYAHLPVFGALRASIAIIRRGELVLVIDRSDGRGLSFPGGFDWPWETSEASVRREVREETGLQVKAAAQIFQYRSSADVPIKLSVFEIEAEGELKDSWEGCPRWMPLGEIRERLLPSQEAVVERLLGTTTGSA